MPCMRMLAVLAAGVLAAASLSGSVAGCGGGVLSPDLVLVNGGEPPYPLIPTSTNDSNGGRILDRLFAGLMSYDAAGNPSAEVAQSIQTTDNVNYRIVLKPGWKFTDGALLEFPPVAPRRRSCMISRTSILTERWPPGHSCEGQ